MSRARACQRCHIASHVLLSIATSAHIWSESTWTDPTAKLQHRVFCRVVHHVASASRHCFQWFGNCVHFSRRATSARPLLLQRMALLGASGHSKASNAGCCRTQDACGLPSTPVFRLPCNLTDSDASVAPLVPHRSDTAAGLRARPRFKTLIRRSQNLYPCAALKLSSSVRRF